MTPRRPVVAVVYAEAAVPVVHAQTIPILETFRAAGRTVDLIAFASPRRFLSMPLRSRVSRLMAAAERASGRAPAVLTYRPRAASFAGAGRRLARALRDRGLRDAVLLCRQPRATLAAAAAREVIGEDGRRPPRVVLDLRGLRDVEYLHSLGKAEDELDVAERQAIEGYRTREREACGRADAIVCVSRAMAEELRRRHPDAAARVACVPNHARPIPDAEELRRTARAKLRSDENALVIAYLGSTDTWQMVEESALLVRALSATRPSVHGLFVTPDVSGVRAILRRVNLANATVAAAEPGEAHVRLAAADYGLVLRRNDAVNRVACPVKFGEYLACGVRPILTPGIGDQSDLLLSTDLGVVVGLGDVTAAARKIVADADRPGTIDLDGRTARREWAAQTISPERAAERLGELLDPMG